MPAVCGCRRVWITSTWRDWSLQPEGYCGASVKTGRPGHSRQSDQDRVFGPARTDKGRPHSLARRAGSYNNAHRQRVLIIPCMKTDCKNRGTRKHGLDVEYVIDVDATALLHIGAGPCDRKHVCVSWFNLRARTEGPRVTKVPRSQGSPHGSGSEGSPRVAPPPVHRSPSQPLTTRP